MWKTFSNLVAPRGGGSGAKQLRRASFERNLENSFSADADVNFVGTPYLFSGTAVAQWLRCCATIRKVAGSIPACVSGIFH